MGVINQFDEMAYNLILNYRSTNTTAIMTFVSFLGSAMTFIILSLALIFLLKNKKDSKFIILNLTVVFLLNRILKIVFARPRPAVISLVSESGYSFPSGHAMVSMGYYGFIIYLICKNISNKKIKYPLIVLISTLILLIGISRVYLGVHYITDVIAGFVISIIYLYFAIKKIYTKKL